MRLIKLKLAGFKSFVDPTVFHVPERVVAIVGPNGCGKSNLIDAVRWVMGESAARQLRGESMEDVIFAGSSARQPVGQAAIELVFDNSTGKLGGAWSHYNEIAVKRVVGRGGQSVYYLNGTRCRRRDITDIFLGTGLGPRSYAIIEQGTISRVIDARPEELRVFLEEAAGVSKYKERRRETENRICHTRDNLDRLTDLRDELERQLRHLQRQARNAEKYRDYRTRERTFKTQLLALRWRDLNDQLQAREREIGARQTELDGALAELRGVESRLEQCRERRSVAAADLERVQARHYQIGSEITRLEQSLEHQRQLRQHRQAELDRLVAQSDETETRIATDRGRLNELGPALEAAESRHAEAIARCEQARWIRDQAEAEWHEGQQQWEQFNQESAIPRREAEVEQARIEQLERQLLTAGHRGERLRAELASAEGAPGVRELAQLQTAVADCAVEVEEHEARLDELHERVETLRNRRAELIRTLDEIRARLQTDQGRLVSLQTLQEAALGAGALRDWQQAQGLQDAPRLAEHLQVTPGWEPAVETVLGDWLEALCVDSAEAPAEALAALSRGELCLLEAQADPGCEVPAGSLAARVVGVPVLGPLLAAVATADSLSEALSQRRTLAADRSVITRDGVWLGRHWLRLARGDTGDRGILERERDIRMLERQSSEDRSVLTALDEQREALDADLAAMEAERDRLREALNQQQREQVRRQEQLAALERGQREQRVRRERLAGEHAELQQQIDQGNDELRAARRRLEQAFAASERLAGERTGLEERRERLRGAFNEARDAVDRMRADQQDQALQLEQLRSERKALEQSLGRLETQRSELDQRRQSLAEGLGDDPQPELRAQLEDQLALRLDSDRDLTLARQALAGQDTTLNELEQARGRLEKRSQQLREQLEALRLDAGETSVRRQHLAEQLAELDACAETVLETLPPEADEPTLQAELQSLAERIQRLGPINLAAIDEHARLAERKTYLDSQDADLREALATLESAMARIDRETRNRFRETYEQVNANLKALFPRLFGGGQAYLDLTGEDTLEAGVALMAQPPGKRIGHIQLLSGGEKALTAIALVFSIFQLNPAPFCLLDEVDAPLDDANVGRFGRLVQELSAQVQFIIVTHNKTTMEIAQHLAGVTMHEPGVSRLVAVDVDEAVRLAAV